MKSRQLNIELMRIFAMLLIFVWHIRGHYIPEAGIPQGTTAVTILTYFCLFITFHVDLFVLITGYFGIRSRRKPIIKTLLLCVFYAIILNLLSWAVVEQFNWEEIVMPVSHSPWWFMQVYFILVLIAPVIEKYVNYSSSTEFNILLIIFIFLDVYLGFLWQIPNFTGHGYDILNFVTVYLLGVWLRKQKKDNLLLRKWWIPAVIFLMCCVLRYKVQPITTFTWTDYNSPLALTMAVCVYCMFLHVRVPYWMQKHVLFLSASAVVVYLITDHSGFRQSVIPLFKDYYISFGGGVWYLELLYVAFFIITLFVACCVFDKIRIQLVELLLKLK